MKQCPILRKICSTGLNPLLMTNEISQTDRETSEPAVSCASPLSFIAIFCAHYFSSQPRPPLKKKWRTTERSGEQTLASDLASYFTAF